VTVCVSEAPPWIVVSVRPKERFAFRVTDFFSGVLDSDAPSVRMDSLYSLRFNKFGGFWAPVASQYVTTTVARLHNAEHRVGRVSCGVHRS